jgi:hypothetical protein
MTSIPIDVDHEKLKDLFQRFKKGILTREEAIELEPLLERERKKALNKGDIELARDIVSMLIGLKGYINHRIDLYGNISVSDSVNVRKISKDSQSTC